MGQLSLIIVGADFPNTDKSNRRSEILWSAKGEDVSLVPEPKNPVDPQAVAVFSARGVQIGYVKSFQAQLIRTYIGRGRVTAAVFQGPHREGAIIRVGLDGELPVLPEVTSESPKDDSGFYPDWIPPDD